jgi:4-hydroxy-tetrahydrodipicolinate synthase
MALFHGLSAFPLTPADADGVVDTASLGGLVERLVAVGVDSVGLLGSTGTYAYLTRDERRRAVRVAAEAIGGRVPLMVGIGHLRTDVACALARDAAAAGADALLLAPVSYTPLTADEVYRHYVAVAAVSALPLCIYNNPGTTGFTFDAALLARLAAAPTIRAVKMPLPKTIGIAEELATLRAGPAGVLAIGYSGDWGGAEALIAGADGWYSVIAGVLPRAALSLARAAQAGDVAEAARLEAAFAPLWVLFREFGGLRVVYAAAEILGLGAFAAPLPILPLRAADRARVAEALAVLDAVL